MDERQSNRQEWEAEVLLRWFEIANVSEWFRMNHIQGEKDITLRNLYTAKLTRLWLELEPDVMNRNDLDKTEVDKFMDFRNFAFDPGLFFEKSDQGVRLYELEEILRIILKRIKII